MDGGGCSGRVPIYLTLYMILASHYIQLFTLKSILSIDFDND